MPYHTHNLIQSFSGATFAQRLNLFILSSSHPRDLHATDISGDKFPNLGIDPVLRDNGSQAKPHPLTLALLPGSPAIDKIPLDACQIQIEIINNGQTLSISTDQRDMKRPDGNEKMCDIGAYKSGP